MFQYFASVAIGYLLLRSIRYYRYHHKFLPKQYQESNYSVTKLKQPKRNPLRDGFTKRKIPSDLDVIVIGSGISGLATAAFLSRVGKKVLVIEQHYIAGGCTHTYEDKGFEFDTGIHYIGNVHKYKPILDCITKNPIQWQKMGYKDYEIQHGSEVYDEIYIGEGDSQRIYRLRAGIDNFLHDMIQYFPEEESAIRKYVKLVQSSSSNNLYFKAKVIKPRCLAHLIQKYFCHQFLSFNNQTAYEVISSLTQNQELIGVLCGQFGDYGPPPTKCSFYMHAAVVNHYFKGGYYPIGGTSVFAKEIIPIIEQNGGRVLVRKEVSRILVDNSGTRAIGVEMENGIQVFAKQIVSSVGINNTFTKLLTPEQSPASLLKKIQQLGVSGSMVYLTVGFNQATDHLQLPSSNLWIWPHTNYETLLKDFANDPEHAPIPLFMGFPSAKDSDWENRHPNRSTAVIITMLPSQLFDQWKETTWNKRPQDYELFKDKLQQRMLQKLYELFPQTKEAVEYCSIGTPLTFNHFLNSVQGETYGADIKPSRYSKNDWLVPRTHISNLFLTGQDILTMGFSSSLYSAILTVCDMLGYGTIGDFILNRDLIQEIRNLPSNSKNNN